MPLPNDGIQPDRFELRLRFVCGALFGSLVGTVAMLRLAPASAAPAQLAAAASLGGVLAGCLGGLVARHFGDRFWRSLRWWFGFWFVAHFFTQAMRARRRPGG